MGPRLRPVTGVRCREIPRSLPLGVYDRTRAGVNWNVVEVELCEKFCGER